MAYIETRERQIDTLTGELISDNSKITSISTIPTEPEYIKLYIDDLSGLCGLTAGETKILLQIAALVDYKGIVALPAGIKTGVAQNVGCTQSAVNNALTSFCRKQIMKKSGIGVYELNPDYFARGKWREIRDRRLSFYAKITYSSENGRTIETNFE